MTRSYNVTSMEVLPAFRDHSNVVIKLNFVYGNAKISLQGSCSLPLPEGTIIPLESISQELALRWLLDNCPNTTEEFDADLDAQLVKTTNVPFLYMWTQVD